eukprot:m.640944 g.640944  ORF g.640944 m.640944 type:complete len:106 (-) comp22625_c0_seq1:55-372(-)
MASRKKRNADIQITNQPGGEEDGDSDEEPTGPMPVAGNDVLSKRKIVTGKRRKAPGSSSGVGAKGAFAGLKMASSGGSPASAGTVILYFTFRYVFSEVKLHSPVL